MNDLVPPKGTMSIEPDDLSEAAEAVEATRVAADVDPANDAEASPEEPVINEQQAAMLMQTFAEEQNLLMGTVGGLLAALLGAGIWAGVTVATEYQIGWMAVGIGFLVGLTRKRQDLLYKITCAQACNINFIQVFFHQAVRFAIV